MKKFHRFRLALALLSGVIGFAITWGIFWLTYRDLTWKHPDCVATRMLVGEVRYAIERFQDKTGRFPSSLEELVSHDGLYADTHAFRDAWDNELAYRKSGNGFVLYSTGRDGSPGGRGLDADIRKTIPYQDSCKLPFVQFVGIEEMLVNSCCAALAVGALVALCAYNFKIHKSLTLNLACLIFGTIGIMVTAFFVIMIFRPYGIIK
jgi:hypothetical protein